MRPTTDHIWRDVFSIISPTDTRERVDEGGGKIERVIAQFAGLVIPREHMMIVVISLTKRRDGYRDVLHRRDVLIVGFLSPRVCDAVDTEGYVQIDTETKIEIHPERYP